MPLFERKYSDEQVAEMIELRNLGWSYHSIGEAFEGLSAEAVRHVIRSRGAPRTKPIPAAVRAKAEPTVAPPRPEDNSRILVISDMHAPYMHPDTVPFLKALKDKYCPTRVICVGDEVDHHALSFHDSDPDLLSAGDELQAAIKALTPLYEMFPEMDLVDSNHGSLLYRRAKHHGIPQKYLRSYNEVLEAPAGWRWHMELLLEVPGGNQVFIHHSLSTDVMKVVAQRGVCVVHGHHHGTFRIGYLGNPNHLLWGMHVGCSIDGRSLAFAYDRNNLPRPIIGHAMVNEGLPQLMPMLLDRNGRWTGVVP